MQQELFRVELPLMKYRADIDGLRAIAVLSVIAFHIDASVLPGGFVGVDVFFVISGYLISLQIFQGIDSGKFSILEFYRRRVKRIAPAMLVTLGTTVLLAQFLFRPEDAEDVARAGVWSLASMANVFFWLSDDGAYFADPSDEQPLLHFWSLGVEEQFYLFWPLILLVFAARIRSRQFIVAAVLVASASFVAGHIFFRLDPSFVYYMLPPRAGELLIGATMAWLVHMDIRGTSRKIPWSAAGGISLLTLAGSLFLISTDRPFPGLWALIPTLATGILIFSGREQDSWVRSMLSLRPLVWVGVVSYSAYLWHWPILAFLRYMQIEISFLVATVAVISTFALAFLSYRYVETPCRRSTRSPIPVFTRQFIVPAAFLGLFAGVCLKSDGTALHRFSPDYLSQLESVRDARQASFLLDYVCQRQSITSADLNDENCVSGPAGTPASTILWGDSNAAHFVGMLRVFAESAGFSFQNVEVGSCPPINSDPVKFVEASRLADCRASNSLIWPYVQTFSTVVISANWPDYFERSDDFLSEFEEMLGVLESDGARVILIGKTPVFDGYDRLCEEKALRLSFIDCEVASVRLDASIISANEALMALARRLQNVDYFDANDYLCPNDVCEITDGRGVIQFYDKSHLTAEASIRLGESIVENDGVPSVFFASDRQAQQ